MPSDVCDLRREHVGGRCEVAAVDQCVRQQHGEPQLSDRVLALLGRLEAAAEDRDRLVVLADHRLRAPSVSASEARSAGRADHTWRARSIAEIASRGFAALEGELAETRQRAAVVLVAPRRGEHLLVQPLRVVLVAEAHRQLRVEQARIVGRGAVLAGCEEVLADAEPAAELSEQLQRRDAVAGLDAGDVRRRAAGEGEVALGEARTLARGAQPLAYGGRIVDVS